MAPGVPRDGSKRLPRRDALRAKDLQTPWWLAPVVVVIIIVVIVFSVSRRVLLRPLHRLFILLLRITLLLLIMIPIIIPLIIGFLARRAPLSKSSRCPPLSNCMLILFPDQGNPLEHRLSLQRCSGTALHDAECGHIRDSALERSHVS